MKIVHFAPFAPNACGLYEAARDMIVADRRAGHDAQLVDVGPTMMDGSHIEGKPGQIDNRGGTEIKTIEPGFVYYADIIMCHTGVADNWIVQCQSPIIWILHGRPAACFQPEQFARGNSYSLMANLATWPRVKKMVTFWPYHVQFWKPIIPEEKLIYFIAPPVDENRFSSEGERHDFKNLGGKYNIMIAESWRDDVDIYELIHGCIELGKTRKDIRFHLYGLPNPLPACWEYLIAELRLLNVLGELWARRPNIEEVYRAADILLSPQRIVTRTIGEALSCGTPVIAAHGCEYATYHIKPDEPKQIADTINKAIIDIEKSNTIIIKNNVNEDAKAFSLEQYSKNINKVYENIL